MIWTLIYLMLFQSLDVHDLHLSKTEISYNKDANSIEIITHIFIDDLELGMGRMAEGLKLGTEQEVLTADSLVAQYLSEHFVFTSGGAPLNWSFIGKEMSDDLMAFWCYMEIEEPNLADDLTVTISLFDDLYDDQKNVIDLKYDKKNRSYALLKKGDNTTSVRIPR